jgi:DNA-binding MarR family transcriptional regulator
VANEKLIEDLVQLWRVLHQLSAPSWQGDLTAQQFWLLRQLRRDGPLRVGQLAKVLGITQSSVTNACKRLEQAGLVSRERVADDERAVLVSLTDAGAQRVDAWRRRRREHFVTLLETLDESEQTALQGLIERLLARAEEVDQ